MEGLNEEFIYCPYCGEELCIAVDTSILEQRYIEDCQVCCRPISIEISIADDGYVELQSFHENE